MYALNLIGTIFLLTRVYLTSGILSSNTSPDSLASARVSSDGYRYAPAGHPFREHREDKPRGEGRQDNGFESVVSAAAGFAVQQGQRASHLHSNTKSTAREKDKSRELLALISRQSHSENNTDRRLKADRCDPSRSLLGDCSRRVAADLSHEEAPSDASKTSTAKPYADQHHPQARRRTSYRITEDFDDSPADDSKQENFPGYYPESTYSSTGSKDLAAAVKILDHFLSRTLNGDDYNSELHPPTNPLLALILSRYGHYLSGAKTSKFYANMAINNIHNHKPFGKYKLERDDDPESLI